MKTLILLNIKSIKAASLLVMLLTFVYLPAQGQDQLKEICEELERAEESDSAEAVHKPKVDAAELYWRSRKKYAIVISVYKSADSMSDLPFAKVDGNLIARKLCALGYTVLDVLTNENATRVKIRSALQNAQKEIRQKNTTLLIYYSGHGVIDEKQEDLWLQVYDESPGDRTGISMPEVIKNVYPDKSKGQLAIVIDSCFSGKAVFSGTLTLADTKNINILSSGSGDEQRSYSIVIAKDGSGTDINASAFSYYITEAITDKDWSKVDDDDDGIITYKELRAYVATRLACDYYLKKKIPALMEPNGLPRDSEELFAFKASKARNFKTPIRKAIAIKETEKLTALESQGLNGTEDLPPDKTNSCDAMFPSTPEPSPSPTPASSQFIRQDQMPYKANITLDSRLVSNYDYFDRVAFQSVEKTPFASLMGLSHVAIAQNGQKSQQAEAQQVEGEKSISAADLASQIYEEGGDNYAAGIKATAEGKYDEARKLLEKTRAQGDIDQSRLYRAIGRNELFDGQYKAAAKWYTEALKLERNEADPLILNEAGNALRLAGNYDEAEKLFQRAISEVKKSSPRSFTRNRIYVNSVGNLARLYHDAGKYERAEQLYETILEIQQEYVGTNSKSVALILNNLAGIYYAKGAYDRALLYSERSLSAMRKYINTMAETDIKPNPEDLAIILDNQGAIERELGNFTKAEGLFSEALKINVQAFGEEHPRTADTILNLAVLRTRQGRLEEAEPMFQRVISLQEKTLGPGHPELVVTLEQYATFLLQVNRKDEAAMIQERVKQLKKTNNSNITADSNFKKTFGWMEVLNPVKLKNNRNKP